MKKALILTNLLWVSIFLFMGFKPNQSKNCNNVCLDYSKEDFVGINPQAAKKMTEYYIRHHLEALKSLNINDSRTVWFKLHTLKKFIWEVEHYNCLSNCPTREDSLGVRVYFGEYPTAKEMAGSDIWSGVNPEYQKLHTVFMVPTFSDRAGVHDFDPIQNYNDSKNSGRCDLTPLSVYLKANVGTRSIPMFAVGVPLSKKVTQKDLQNHGTLCPPLCNNQDLAF